MSLKIAVVYGSVRRNRKGIRAARFVCRQCEERGHEVTLIDPLEYELPMLDLMYKEYDDGQAPKAMEKVAAIYRSADAFIFCSGEYNHGIPPALKNLIDHFMNEYFWRPAGIASYSASAFGGVRAAMQLRATLGEVGLVTVPSIFAMPKVGKTFDEEGNALDDSHQKRIGKFLDELEWYAKALRAARKKGVPYE